MCWASLPVLAVLGSAGVERLLPRPRNPPVVASRTIEAYVPVPGEVEAIMARSCRDCHSFETRWPCVEPAADCLWHSA